MSDSSDSPAAAVRAEIAERASSLAKLETAAIRDLRRGWTARIAGLPAREVVDLAFDLVERDEFRGVPRFVACEIVQNHAAALASIVEDDLTRLGSGMASHSDVDAFACYVAGLAWRAGQVPDEAVERWTDSEDRWWRRAALVATVPLNTGAQGGKSDADRTLRVCERLLDDKDDLVVKALSWALRALAKRDPAPVGRFLSAHGDRVPTYVYRDVANVLRGATKAGRPGSRPSR